MTNIQPYSVEALKNPVNCLAFGRRILRRGEAACLVLAGGQGTRLGHDGPKGTFPISPERGISLFELLAEQVRSASRWAGRPLSIAVMTSQDNDLQTRAFFRRHASFGLEPEQLSFIVQESLPFLDEAGRPLEMCGPAGNGSALKHLAEQGVVEKWERQGVRYVTVIPIDNPLADPFDVIQIGSTAAEADVGIKCVLKESEDEPVGVIVEREGKAAIIEYSALSIEQRRARDPDGQLRYRLAHVNLFCFSMPFLKKVASLTDSLPFHMAKKPVSSVEGAAHAFKRERFLFDCLPWADRVQVLVCPRKTSFAPLKDGASVERVREALRNCHRL